MTEEIQKFKEDIRNRVDDLESRSRKEFSKLIDE